MLRVRSRFPVAAAFRGLQGAPVRGLSSNAASSSNDDDEGFGGKHVVPELSRPASAVPTTTAKPASPSTPATAPPTSQQKAASPLDQINFEKPPVVTRELYSRLREIDLSATPVALPPDLVTELKGKLHEINSKIRSQLGMAPRQFMSREYRNRAGPTMRGDRLPPDFHPLYGNPDDIVDEGVFAREGLVKDDHALIFQLAGDSLPKPTPQKPPCMFCHPSRDFPPQHYTIVYTNVNLLHSFINERGMITKRRANNNCGKHQRKVARAIKRARHIGLLSFVSNFHVPRWFVPRGGPLQGDLSGVGGVGFGAPSGGGIQGVPLPSRVPDVRTIEAVAETKSPYQGGEAVALRHAVSRLPLGQIRGFDWGVWDKDGTPPARARKTPNVSSPATDAAGTVAGAVGNTSSASVGDSVDAPSTATKP